MDAGDFTFALTIPPNFQRDVLAGKNASLQLNVDATRMSQAFSGSGYIQQIALAEVHEFAQRHRAATALPVALELRARFNPALNKIWFGALMQIINNVTMLSIILTGAALIREREHGTIEHLLVMPVTPTQIMLAKVWSMGAVVLLAAGICRCNLVVRGLLQVPDRGQHRPVHGRCGAVPVRHHGDGHLPGHRGALHAAVRPADGADPAAAAAALGRHDAGANPCRSWCRRSCCWPPPPTSSSSAQGHPLPGRWAGRGVAARLWPWLAIGSALFALSLARFRKTIGQMA